MGVIKQIGKKIKSAYVPIRKAVARQGIQNYRRYLSKPARQAWKKALVNTILHPSASSTVADKQKKYYQSIVNKDKLALGFRPVFRGDMPLKDRKRGC